MRLILDNKVFSAVQKPLRPYLRYRTLDYNKLCQFVRNTRLMGDLFYWPSCGNNLFSRTRNWLFNYKGYDYPYEHYLLSVTCYMDNGKQVRKNFQIYRWEFSDFLLQFDYEIHQLVDHINRLEKRFKTKKSKENIPWQKFGF